MARTSRRAKTPAIDVETVRFVDGIGYRAPCLVCGDWTDGGAVVDSPDPATYSLCGRHRSFDDLAAACGHPEAEVEVD